MATVYLARDLRHDRDVAIKVLHPDLAAALGGERFLSEIKTTAKLQHPHILPLLDSGEADGLLFYVMPFVKGETLGDRLKRETQLPVADALRIASEVADALGCAHEAGIIHRDIKPDNILLQSGHALVADFGIALAVQQAGGLRLTQTGLSLGTPQYMAPEQAMGDKSIDHRADVYALAAVTYEMLTGEPPHTGASAQAIVAKLLTEEVRPARVVRPAVPEHVDEALQVALQKLPADRFATVQEFARSLRGEEESRVAPARGRAASRKSSPPVPRRFVLPALAGLSALLALALAAALLRSRPDAPTSRQQVVLWHASIPNPMAAGAPLIANQAAISPDGESIVFMDSTSRGWMLMRKRRNAAIPEPIEGTEGAVSPTFSPDGKWLAFATMDGRIKRMPAVGGSAIVVTETAASDFKSLAWLDDGSIVWTVNNGAHRISATGGGSPRALRVALPNAAPYVLSLSSLPGSRGVLMSLCRSNCALAIDAFVYDFAADSLRLLLRDAVGAWYSPTGHLLYTSRDGGLFAVKFDLGSMEVRSPPVPVADGVAPGQFAISPAGSILYTMNPSLTRPSELMWVSRDGRSEPFDSTWKARFEYPAISPDGRSVAVSTRERTSDLWIRRSDGSRRRVNAPVAGSWRPSWLADGRSLVFIGFTDATGQEVAVWRVDADASSPAQRILRHRFPIWEAEVSPDTQWLVFRTDEAPGGPNIYARHLHGDTTNVPIAVSPTNDIQIALSPDGRRIAYTAVEGGSQQVFVASFPDTTVKRLVSRGRGYEPRWSRDGRELFFESDGRLVSVTIGASADIPVTEPKVLFQLTGYRRARNRPQYDVAPDGRRFLMIKDPPPPPVPPVVYVEHWFAELEAKLKQ